MSTKTLLPNQHVPLHFLYGRDDCCLCNAQKEIDRLKTENQELKNKHNALIQACKKMKMALREGGWGHSILCNFPVDPSQKPTCNCGVNDMLTALKIIENQTL